MKNMPVQSKTRHQLKSVMDILLEGLGATQERIALKDGKMTLKYAKKFVKLINNILAEYGETSKNTVIEVFLAYKKRCNKSIYVSKRASSFLKKS